MNFLRSFFVLTLLNILSLPFCTFTSFSLILSAPPSSSGFPPSVSKRALCISFQLYAVVNLPVPPSFSRRFCELPFALVGTSGLEPPTSRLSGECSNQLSYVPVPDTKFDLASNSMSISRIASLSDPSTASELLRAYP